MKKGIILVVFLVAVGAMVGFSTFGNKDLNEVVGYIDGEAVQVAELQNYVDTLLGINYAKKMETKEGRQELFNHYVNRKLLLEYAKKNIKEDESFVKSHTMGNVSSESALISAVFKKEINDKVRYTEEEVKALVEKDKKFTNMQDAEREIISQKRLELFYAFMDKLKADRKIELAG